MINRPLPEQNATLAGYAALIDKHGIVAPVPLFLAAISKKHTKYETDNWRVFTPRHAPKDTLYGHLVFALRYEGLDLSVLGALFAKIDGREIEDLVKKEPNGAYARRIWFLYEYLQEVVLDIPNLSQGNFANLLDDQQQYAGPPRPSKRHRIRNNLPGVKDFCPLVRRTEKLEQLIAQDLSNQALENMGAVPEDILMRAATSCR